MPELMSFKLSSVKPEPVSWLWPGRIPRGKVTLIAGDPGLGKSFVTMDIAARVSRGHPWPEVETPLRAPGEVVILNGEDDAGDTLRPRVEAAGGDVDKLHFIEGVDRDSDGEWGQGYFELDRDTQTLSRFIKKLQSPRLVIIDPISAFMGGVDTHRNADVRAVLARLSAIASAHNVAVVCVTHLSKASESGGKKAVHRLMGSLAFAAAARMVWMIGKHPDDPDRRVMTLVKSNLAATKTGLAYSIGVWDKAPQAGPRVLWEETPYTGTADALEDATLAEEESAADEASRFLRELLKGGAVAAAEVMRQVVEAGVSEQTIRRVKRRVGVRVNRRGGKDGSWVWSLATPERT